MNTDWISTKQLSELLKTSELNVWQMLSRCKKNSITIKRKLVNRQKLISVSSLLDNKIITQEQANSLLVRQTIEIDNSTGNALLASSIVQKKFENLSESEVALLEKIPNWKNLGRTKIVGTFSVIFKKHRSWFYADHCNDGRKEKPKAIEKLSPDQIRAAQQDLILSRGSKMTFVEKILDNELMPDFSRRTWYRVFDQLSLSMVNEIDYMKEGKLKMRSRLAPVIRDRTFLKPLESAVTDFWRIDLVTKWFDGSLVRPSCVVIQDWRTGKIVGRAITKFPNSLGVKVALLDCFLHHGTMEQLNIDNGKEFVAHRIIGTKMEQQLVRVDYSEVEDKLKRR